MGSKLSKTVGENRDKRNFNTQHYANKAVGTVHSKSNAS